MSSLIAFIQDRYPASSVRYITGQLVGKSDSYNKMRFCKQRKHGSGCIKNCHPCDLFILVHYANQLVQMILIYEMHLIASMNQLKWYHALFHCNYYINQDQDGVIIAKKKFIVVTFVSRRFYTANDRLYY